MQANSWKRKLSWIYQRERERERETLNAATTDQILLTSEGACILLSTDAEGVQGSESWGGDRGDWCRQLAGEDRSAQEQEQGLCNGRSHA